MSFYPDNVNKYSRIGKIMKLTGWEPRFFYWQYKTVCDYQDKGEGINRYCTDISKSHVDKCFFNVYGYSSLLDPNLEHEVHNKAVVKSEENFAKDGKIVGLPVDIADDKVCQRLIDTKTDEGFVDWRPVIVMGNVKGFIKKIHSGRFDSGQSKMTFHRDVFDEGRVQAIEAFCTEIGMDYGELDYLIDNDTGSHFIIDANKTPGGASKVGGLGDEFINAHKPLFI